MSRVWMVALVVALTPAVSVLHVARAEACGLKLTVQATKVKKGVQPSSNPSRILLLGEPPARLDKALAQAGHQVEVAEEADDNVKTKQFNVVLVEDAADKESAQKIWPDAQIMEMKKSTSANLASVEDSLTRKPTDSSEKRAAIAARETRQPIAAGPDEAGGGRGRVIASSQGEQVAASDSRPVAAGGAAAAPRPAPEAAKPAPEPIAAAKPVEPPPAPPAPAKPEPAPAAKPEPSKPLVAAAPVKPEPKKPAVEEDDFETDEPEPVARKAEPTPTAPRAPARDEGPSETELANFALGSSQLAQGARTRLNVHAKWLKNNPNGKLIIEGHTDAIGPEDYNLSLGERRANSAKAYLKRLGADESRIEVVSYGEGRPKYDPPENPKNRRVNVRRE